MEVGNKIYELRKNAKLSQEQLAEKINVTRQTISNWELGQTVPDIIQATEISKIFNITLDELVDNNVKDILVEKISNTEKMANKTLKIIKFLSIIFIIFLVMVILLNTIFIIKRYNENLEIQAQEQAERQAYRDYLANGKMKYFNIYINEEQYSYMVQYGEDYGLITNCFASVGLNNDDENWTKYYDYFQQTVNEYSDVRDQIDALKQYFENQGGTWEEIPAQW
jgi:transcriptional regulator with XRE-family HTH domain